MTPFLGMEPFQRYSGGCFQGSACPFLNILLHGLGAGFKKKFSGSYAAICGLHFSQKNVPGRMQRCK
jgi:hypothetical protein